MERLVIGIDLGTENTCIAAYDGKNLRPIQTNDGRVTSTCVYFDPKTQQVLIGKKARFKNGRIQDAKRFIRRNFADQNVQRIHQNYSFKINSGPDNNACFEIPHNNNNVQKKPEDVLTEFLRNIKEQLCAKYKCIVVEAVVTVPVHFKSGQRDGLTQAIKDAGIHLLALLADTSAAALYYLHVHPIKQSKVMVIDFGTALNVSIIDFKDEQIVDTSRIGNAFIGGRKFEENIMDYFITQLEKDGKTGNNLMKHRLRVISQNLMKSLSIAESAEEYLMMEDQEEDCQLTRQTFNDINKSDFQQCISTIHQCLDDNHIVTQEIDVVIVVGGSSRIPKLQEMLRDIFGDKLKCDLDVDEAIAGGAAIEAFNSTNHRDLNHFGVISSNLLPNVNFVDLTCLSLGVSTIFGETLTVIPKNTELPATKSIKMTTDFNNQTELVVKIFEGERKCAKHNKFIGELKFSNLPEKPAGQVSAEISFDLNEDGFLKVMGVSDDQKKYVEVQLDQLELTEDEVKAKINDAVANAVYDDGFERFVMGKHEMVSVINKHPNCERLQNILISTEIENRMAILREINTVLRLQPGLGGQLKSIWDRCFS